MEKIDFKELMQKAKAGADDGIKRAGEVAQKAAAGVNDGLDAAKESLRKSSISKKAVNELRNTIKDLEKENKAKVQDDILEETNTVINQLKDLLQIIRNDPENCVEAIDSLAREYRLKISSMVSGDLGNDSIKIQVMSKRYDDALRGCLQAKVAIEEAII